MEKTQKSLFLFLIAGTCLFNFLFWKESLGVNTLIFDVFIVISLFAFGFKSWKSTMSGILILSLLLSALAIIWHSSVYTIVMHYITLFLIIGLIHEEGLDSIIFLINSAFISLFKFPSKLFNQIPKKEAIKFKKIFKILKLSLIPIFILWIFYIIYKYANPVFAKLSFRFLDKLNHFIVQIFKNVSFAHICFIILGLGLTAWIIFKTGQGKILAKQAGMLSNLLRKRKMLTEQEKLSFKNLKDKAPIYYRKKFALSLKFRSEAFSASVLLILINVLLLIVNIVDINWVWFGFQYSESFDLKQFVHEGTYLLIISILLSMGIMLYFFRRNLNFYKKGKHLKLLTYSWIVQNFILAISVTIRNFRYIEYWGLAYKRIGVILFLIAVVYGLFTLFYKIRFTKTAYYLIKKNTIAVFVILLLSSLLNWDLIIAKHNLNHPLKNHMETSYLLCLSDKVLPMIQMHEEVLNQELKYNTYEQFYPYSYRQYYDYRVKKFIQNYEKRSWVSWNYAEWKAYKYYTNELKSIQRIDK